MKKEIKNLMAKSLSALPDTPYCKLTFLIKNRRYPRLNNPTYINDKLLKMKLSDRNPMYKQLVDKYAVRSFIKETVGEQYLIPLIGVYDDPSDVNFETLPDKFVLKPTFSAQNNLICTTKKNLDWEKEIPKIREWLKVDPYKRTREWQYKDLPKRFVVEEYIADSYGKTNDYKFWCFHGIPEIVQIDSDRFGSHKRNIYEAETFKELGVKISHQKSKDIIKKPVNYERMLSVASMLSKNLAFARIDLYNIDGKVYFGEITLYPGNCNERITPLEYERVLGDKLVIS